MSQFEVVTDPLIGLAATIAALAHKGQKDKLGKPYIDHPHWVANDAQRQGLPVEAIAAAWLHDVLEDTTLTGARLLELGIPASVVEIVEALTHPKSESNLEYYARVKKNPLALQVKLCDIRHNTDPGRMKALPEETATRLRTKYAIAVEALTS